MLCVMAAASDAFICWASTSRLWNVLRTCGGKTKAAASSKQFVFLWFCLCNLALFHLRGSTIREQRKVGCTKRLVLPLLGEMIGRSLLWSAKRQLTPSAYTIPVHKGRAWSSDKIPINKGLASTNMVVRKRALRSILIKKNCECRWRADNARTVLARYGKRMNEAGQ